MNRFIRLNFFCAMGWLIAAFPLQAATWIGVNPLDSLWTTAGNWDTAAVPTAGDDVIIDNTAIGGVGGIYTAPKIVAGDTDVASTIQIGYNAPAELNITGGALNAGWIRVGQNTLGASYINFSSGTVTNTGSASTRFGFNDNTAIPGCEGYLNMSGDAKWIDGAANFFFGRGGNGHLSMSGTSNLTSAGSIWLGSGPGDAHSTATMSDGSWITVANEFRIGAANTGNGSVSGLLTMTGTSSLSVATHLRVGYDGTVGTMNIGPGTNVHVGQWLQVGNNDGKQGVLNSGVGIVNMTGGTVTKDAVAGTYMLVGRWATGSWNQSGGLADIRTVLCLGQAGYTGTLNLDGGVFSVGLIQMGYENDANAIGVINFNGGTLKVNTNSFYQGSNFINPYESTRSNLFVKSGGAMLDSSGSDISIGLPLQAASGSPGGGLIKIGGGILTLTGANTYTGPTTVTGGGLGIAVGSTLASKNITVNNAAALVVGAGSASGYNLSALHLNNGSTANFVLGAAPTASDAINVTSGGTGNLDLAGGTGNVNLALSIAGRGISSSPYTLFNFNTITGGLSNLTVTPLSRATFTKAIVGNSVRVTLTSLNAKSLTWVDGADSNWQTGGPVNWRDVVPPTTPANQTFQELDTVHFTDDATINHTVNLVGRLHPLDVFVDSSSDYSFNGTGGITGIGTTLTKSGTGKLTLNNTGANDFTGDVAVTGGTVAFSAKSALGLNNTVSVSGFGTALTTTGAWLGDGSTRNLSISDNAQVTIGGTAIIGQKNGPGTLDLQTSSSLNVTGNFWVAPDAATDVGTVTVSDSQVTVGGGGWTVIGGRQGSLHGGTGTVNVNGSSSFTADPTAYLIVGYRGGTGTLNINNGNVSANAFQVANAEFRSTTTGTLNMTGNAYLTVNSFETGFRANAVAVVNMSDYSTVFNAGSTFIGHYGGPGCSSTLNMSGNSSFNDSTGFQIANSENSDYHTLGIVNMTDSSTITENAYFIIGAWSGSNATLNMSGNSKLIVYGEQFDLGYGGATSTINLSGNASITNLGTTLGTRGEGNRGTSSTLNLNGGLFATSFLLGGSDGSTQTVNFNGGTLQAQADSNVFMAGTSAFQSFVKSGGANIDTTSHLVRMSVPLSHDPALGSTADGGLTVTGTGSLTLSAQNTYTGPTTVNGGALMLARDATMASKVFSVADGSKLTLGSASNLGSLTSLSLTNAATFGIALTPNNSGANTVTTASFPTRSSSLKIAVSAQGTSLATGPYVIIHSTTAGATATPSATINIRGLTATAATTANDVTVTIAGTADLRALTWTGSGSTWDTKTTAGWSGGTADNLFYELDSVTFPDLGNLIVGVTGTVHPTSISIDCAGTDKFNDTGGGNITGIGTTLTKTGVGKALIDVPIDITGDISLQGGTLTLGPNSGTNTLKGNVAFSGGSILEVTGPQLTLPGTISDVSNSGMHLAGTGSVVVTNEANPLHGPTVLDGTGGFDVGVTLHVSKLANGGQPSSIGDSSSDPSNLVFNGGTLKYVGAANVVTDRGFSIQKNWSFINTAKDITFTGLVTTSNQLGGFVKTGPGALSLTNVNNSTNFSEVQVREGILNLSGDATHTPTYGISTAQDTYGSLIIGVAGRSAAVNVDHVNLQFGSGNLYLGTEAGSSGYIKIKDGVSLTSLAGYWAYVGQNGGTGVLDQTGGYLQTGQYTSIGEGSLSFGVYNMTGGTADINNLAAPYSFNVGVSGASTGVLNVSGTAHMIVAPGAPIYIGVYDSSTGIVNLGAVGSTTDTSVLTAPGIGRYNSAPTTTKGYLNFHGGTLQANADSVNFLAVSTPLTGAFIYGEGAKIDTNGHAITINTPISTPTGFGVTNIAVSGGSGYIGAPAVEITGGSGTGATAYAVMSGGTVDHIVISNPGTGYLSTDVLTLQLYGQVGAGGTPATLGAVTFAHNVNTGGLTKLGLGTLTLTNSFDFTGPTVISQGRLSIDNGLNNTLTTISGAGELAVGVTNAATVLSATSINVGTLTIGSGSSATAAAGSTAVPEPGTLVLLVLAGLALAGTYLRRK